MQIGVSAETGRQTDSKTDRQKDRETEADRDRLTGRQTDKIRQVCKQIESRTDDLKRIKIADGPRDRERRLMHEETAHRTTATQIDRPRDRPKNMRLETRAERERD